MTPIEAAELIETIGRSLTEKPNQFTLDVKIEQKNTGFHSTGSNGGTGSVINVSGGAPGSKTVGVHATASAGNIEVNQELVSKVHHQHLQQQSTEFTQALVAMIKELRQPEPSKSVLWKLAESLPEWVPDVVKSVIAYSIGSSTGG